MRPYNPIVTPQEKAFFLEHGYLLVESVLQGEHSAAISEAFNQVWEIEQAPPCSQHQLLKHKPFIDLIEHPPILERQRAIFGEQV